MLIFSCKVINRHNMLICLRKLVKTNFRLWRYNIESEYAYGYQPQQVLLKRVNTFAIFTRDYDEQHK